ncbi:MAG TPA: phosphoglycolate phosphatase [Rikenellaceae bacterium]|nr:phosphoglycolate phosphatase [Rikenellaceae bacterium]
MKLVIFDLDGTLVNTIEDLGVAVNHVLAKTGRPLHDITEYRMMVGNGVRKLIQRALPIQEQGDETLPDKLLPEFIKYYGSHCTVHSKPYPGITELLAELSDRGVGMAVASNKYQEGTSAIVRHFFPEVPFVAVLGGCDERALKPSDEIINAILDTSGVSKSDCVMVGDSGTDIQTARNAGIRSIGVTWGFRPEAAAQADEVADSTGRLKELLISF